jgi:BASS family bile acid:Na+ symporter
MSARALVMTALFGGIVLTGVAVGCRATWSDATALLRDRSALLRSMLSMFIVAPILASVVATMFNLHPAVKIALVVSSVSPVPPFLPTKAIGAGGERRYVIGLLVAASVLSIFFVPLALDVFELVFNVPLEISPLRIARTVSITVLLPLGAGMLLQRFAPALADRFAKPIGITATALLGVGAIALLAKEGPGMWALVGNRTLLAMAVFAAAAIAVGHFLGGSIEGDRAALALSTASRHPGVPIAVAAVNFPDQTLVVPAVLMLALVGMIVAVPYLKWIGHTGVTVPGGTG